MDLRLSAHWRSLFWCCILAVLILALAPTAPELPSTGWDKGNHVLAFAVLAILGLRAYAPRVAAIMLGLLAYGGLIEVLQSFTTYRLAEWGDLLADGIGILAGSALLQLFDSARRRAAAAASSAPGTDG